MLWMRIISALVVAMVGGTGVSNTDYLTDENAVANPDANVPDGATQEFTNRGGVYSIPVLNSLVRFIKSDDVDFSIYINGEPIEDSVTISKSKDHEIWYVLKTNYPIHITDIEIEIEDADSFGGKVFLKALETVDYTIENVSIDGAKTIDIKIENPYVIEIEDDFDVVDASNSTMIESKDIPEAIKPLIIEDTYHTKLKINYYRIEDPTTHKFLEKELAIKITE